MNARADDSARIDSAGTNQTFSDTTGAYADTIVSRKCLIAG